MSSRDKSSTRTMQTVVVESSLGPIHGYYHKEENGTWQGPKEMPREEAEELGYSPCSDCFDIDYGDSDE